MQIRLPLSSNMGLTMASTVLEVRKEGRGRQDVKTCKWQPGHGKIACVLLVLVGIRAHATCNMWPQGGLRATPPGGRSRSPAVPLTKIVFSY